MKQAIEIKDLCKHYAGFSLDHVSFTVPQGCVTGLIGENGAGKSTTLRLLLNMAQPDSGEVLLFGEPLRRGCSDWKEEIGVVLDEANFFNDFSAHDLGRVLSGVYRSWDAAAYRDYLQDFGLKPAQRFREYSRGMRMKLSLATALAHHPRLLILDEPTSGLDPVFRSGVLDILQDYLQDESHSILLSSHITSDLERIADYIVFLHQGRVLLQETKDTLLEEYGLLRCSAEAFEALDQRNVIHARHGRFGCEALVRNRRDPAYQGLTVDRPSLDDIMVFYAGGDVQ